MAEYLLWSGLLEPTDTALGCTSLRDDISQVPSNFTLALEMPSDTTVQWRLDKSCTNTHQGCELGKTTAIFIPCMWPVPPQLPSGASVFPRTFLLTAASYSHSTNTSICFMGSFFFFLGTGMPRHSAGGVGTFLHSHMCIHIHTYVHKYIGTWSVSFAMRIHTWVIEAEHSITLTIYTKHALRRGSMVLLMNILTRTVNT